jgi:starvation-inducible DNA-binding protein
MDNLIELLEKYQANVHVAAMNLHNLHWNLEDILFHSLHPYLGDLYDQVSDYEDEIAEQIRFFGGRPLTTISDIQNISSINDISSQSFSAPEAIRIALADILALHNSTTQLVAAADAQNAWSMVEKFSAHLVAYEKVVYFLRSSSSKMNRG